MTPAEANRAILSALKDASPHLVPLFDFLPGPLPAPEPLREIKPMHRPAADLLPICRAATTPAFAPLVEAIIQGAPALHWIRSYSEADGMSAAFMNGYAYVNLISPEGPFLSDDYRLCIGFWAEGLDYHEHWHEPEETYAVIAGDVTFHAKGRAPRRARPGDTVHHPSNLPHATIMDRGPMLAVIGWKGGALMRRPEIAAGELPY